MSNWINVKDDLPPYFEEVLISVRTLGVFTAVLVEMRTGAGMKWRAFKKKYQVKIDNTDVTHWMRLPQPPNS